MATIRELLVKINGDNSGLNNALINTGEQLKAVEKNAKATAAMFADFGKKMTMSVTLPIVAMGAAIVKSTADMEMQQAAFETMLGSAEEAAKMLDQIKTMAAKTPFNTTDLTQATKTLLQFGVNARDVLPTIRQLGDVAGGNSQRFQQLSLAFGQMSSAGRLMGQDLLQMINAGFNPLKVISEKTGESMATLKKRMESGGVSAQEVSEAFKIATSEGGMFFNGMDRASQTLSGQFATLMDEVAELGRSFGEILLPILKDLVSRATDAVKSFALLDNGTKKTILIIAGLAAALGPVALGIGGIVQALNVLKGVMMMATSPTGWIVIATAAVVALGVAMAVTIKKNIELQKIYSGESVAPLASQLAMIEEQAKKTEKEYENFVNKTKNLSIQNKNDLDKIALYGGEAGIKKEKERLERIREIQVATIDELKKKIKEQEGAQEDLDGTNKDGIAGVEDLTEAEKTYDAAMAMANAEIDKATPQLEKLYAQFETLENLKTTSAEDEDARLRALAVIREQAFKLEMEEMAKLGKETKDLGEELNAFYGQTEDAAAGIASMGEAFTTSGEELTALSEYMNGTLLPTMDKVFDAVARVTGAIAGQDSELSKSISVWKDWIGGFGRLIAGDWIGGIIQMIDGLTKAITMNIDAMKKSKKAMEEGIKVTLAEGDAIEELYAKLADVNAMIPYLPENMAAAFIKVANELKKQIKDSFQVSIVDALNEALMAGSYADFSQAIGKMVYSIASQFVLASIGLQPMIEKLSAMIVSALEDGAIDESEMSAIQAEAANIYNTASAALAPLQAIINSTFGTSIGIPSTSGNTGGISETETEAIGSFASGVRNWRGGLARVGEQGPETVYLPRGSSVEPGAGQRGGAVINIYSPKALDPMSARANMLAASRQLAFETGGNF